MRPLSLHRVQMAASASADTPGHPGWRYTTAPPPRELGEEHPEVPTTSALGPLEFLGALDPADLDRVDKAIYNTFGLPL
ncbi:MAG: hypothetical protein DLM60_10045 [Pseudonocardiales bacterium]|nr:MAG: hypothetical protein DLM60_10045 [Pseudonocardiales bacterium]